MAMFKKLSYLAVPLALCLSASFAARSQHFTSSALHASSARVQQQTAETAQDPWWKHAVIYEIYPRSFQDTNGDGVGDINGITSRLDYLHDLGIGAIWITPMYPSPLVDFGYDVAGYTAIDPLYGTMADFEHLMAEAKKRNIRVIMDFVPNHTSDEHPWFKESRSSIDSPKRDWYWWRPAREGMQAGAPGAEPTNWASFFSGSAWQLDEASGQYYLHLFSRKQPDLNWENPEVRQAVYAMMRWWLDRGIDGFRMDSINMISKDPALPDGHVLSGGLWGDGQPHFICGPRWHEFLQEMHREVFADRAGQFLTVGEALGITVEEGRVCTDPGRAELDMVIHFEHVQLGHGNGGKWDIVPFGLLELKAVLGRWQAGLAEVGWNSLYWNNHDQPRAVSRFGEDGQYRVQAAKLLGTVLHLHRQALKRSLPLQMKKPVRIFLCQVLRFDGWRRHVSIFLKLLCVRQSNGSCFVQKM